MESFISNDSFDAFRTENGIEIHEKKAAAKKFSVVILVLGIIFIGIGFIPMEGLTYDWITTMFTAVFFYGGIVLVALGLLVLIVKGGNKAGPVTSINKNTQSMTLRGKTIPFAEMGSVNLQIADVMKRKMTTMIFTQNGKKKPLISGTVFTEDIASLQSFVTEINTLIAGSTSAKEN